MTRGRGDWLGGRGTVNGSEEGGGGVGIGIWFRFPQQHPWLDMSCDTMSMGMGKTMVLFFSAEMLLRVCR